jgi:hypothetical protein
MRRLRFAAPVVIVACGGAPLPPTRAQLADPDDEWRISKDDDGCWADTPGECPSDPEITCNPPGPTAVDCVYRDGARVVKVDGACWETAPVRHVPCPDADESSDDGEASQPIPPWMSEGKY